MVQRVSDGQRADAAEHLPGVRLVACGGGAAVLDFGQTVPAHVRAQLGSAFGSGSLQLNIKSVQGLPGVQPKPPSKF